MLTDRERATVLAALRFWSAWSYPARSNIMPHFTEHSPLDDEEIDDLCEALNQESRLIITVRRGLVQEVYTTELHPNEVWLVDYDDCEYDRRAGVELVDPAIIGDPATDADSLAEAEAEIERWKGGETSDR